MKTIFKMMSLHCVPYILYWIQAEWKFYIQRYCQIIWVKFTNMVTIIFFASECPNLANHLPLPLPLSAFVHFCLNPPPPPLSYLADILYGWPRCLSGCLALKNFCNYHAHLWVTFSQHKAVFTHALKKYYIILSWFTVSVFLSLKWNESGVWYVSNNFNI